jgi:uncharacterized protein YjiS (DUF1127 family)
MAIIHQTPTSNHNRLREAAHHLVWAMARFWRRRQNRRSIMNLSEFDDHRLADLGLSRHDVASGLSLPSSQDPSHHLNMIAAGRR